jgi:uncharacterized OB-fold protein
MNEEIMTIPASWSLDFEHGAGKAGTRFLTALRDEAKILGSPCRACGRVLAPPREFCELCFVATDDDWIALGPEGRIDAFTIVHVDLPGHPKPPYAVAYVHLDRASTALCNYVEGVDLSDPDAAAERLSGSPRVRTEFVDDRQGRLTDFRWRLVSP